MLFEVPPSLYYILTCGYVGSFKLRLVMKSNSITKLYPTIPSYPKPDP